MVDIYLIGAGAFSRELSEWALSGKTNFSVISTLNSDQVENENGLFYPSVGNIHNRKKIIQNVKSESFNTVEMITVGKNLIAGSVSISGSCLVMNDVSIAANTKIGFGCDFHGGSIIGHDVVIGDFCSIGARSFVGGGAILGSNIQVFPGALIAPNVNICDDVVIGIGSVVIRNISKPGTYFGNPAVKIS